MIRRLWQLMMVLAMAWLSVPAQAMGMTPVWMGSPALEAWVPEKAETIRGVIVLNGWPLDGRWMEAAAAWNYAILRCNTDGYGDTFESKADDPKYAPLREKGVQLHITGIAWGIKRLGEITGHPEVKNVPIVASGYSRFSNSAEQMMAAFPDRALCFLNGHGGGPKVAAGDKKNQLVWQTTPSQGLQCEWENIFSGGDKTKMLDSWWKRHDGNLSMMAIHWRVYHSPKTFADLGIVLVDQAIKKRVPEDWDPKKEKVKLKTIKESEGWLGSHKGWRVEVEDILKTDNENAHIAPFEKFDRKTHDIERTSWLISEEMAWTWRAFSSRYPQARIVAPGTANEVLHQDPGPAPVGHLESGVRAGVKFRAAAQAYATDMKKVEFFAYNKKLGESSEFKGGDAALGSTRFAVCEIEATIDEPGVHAILARYTTSDGKTGWAKPLSIVVWPRESVRDEIKRDK